MEDFFRVRDESHGARDFLGLDETFHPLVNRPDHRRRGAEGTDHGGGEQQQPARGFCHGARQTKFPRGDNPETASASASGLKGKLPGVGGRRSAQFQVSAVQATPEELAEELARD